MDSGEPRNLEDLARVTRSGAEGARPPGRGPHPVRSITMPIEGGSAEVELSLVDDRIEATGVYVSSDRPLTTTMMRAVPWASLIERAKRQLLSGAEAAQDVDAGVRRQQEVWPMLSEEAHQRMAEAVARAAHKAIAPLEASLGRPGRPRQYGPEHFAEVARVYSEAYRAGSRSPTKAVAERFTISRSAAAKQVARVREAGLLPTTEQRVARGGLAPRREEQ